MSPIHRLAIIGFIAFLFATAAADAAPLWQELPRSAVQANEPEFPTLPAGAQDAIAVVMDGAALQALDYGDRVWLPLVSETLELIVAEQQVFVNRDHSLRADSDDGVLTLTWGADIALGRLEYGERVWQLQVRREPGTDRFLGWRYRSDGLADASPEKDYVIPDAARRPTRAMPAVSSGGMALASGETITDENHSAVQGRGIELDQKFSRHYLLIDEVAEASLQITMRNLQNFSRTMPALDIYFLLEDAMVLSMPSYCSRRGGAQAFLRCETGATVGPGQTRTLQFELQIGPEDDTGRLVSSACFDGSVCSGIRHDAYINVVPDVVGDDQLAELSPFNAALLDFTPLDARGDVVIDVLALHTRDARQKYPGQVETRINQLFAVANQIYRDSAVAIRLRPVHHEVVDYDGSDDFLPTLQSLTHAEDPAFADVARLRDTVGADLVVLFQTLADDGRMCGMANLGGYRSRGYFGPYNDGSGFQDSDFAYSLVALDCPISSVLAHEVGHNMGLTHSHAENRGGGTFNYATGHGVQDRFVTVMADPSQFGRAERVARFSSPELRCADDLPCGVDHRAEQGADAVRTLNTVALQIANYRESRLPLLPGRQVSRLDGRSTQARISMAATADEGRTLSDRVSPARAFDVRAEFYAEDQHIGREVRLYLLVESNGEFYQMDANGVVYAGWDGRIESLIPRSEPLPLGAVESRAVLEDLRLPDAWVGREVLVYVAYEVLDSGEFIFTEDPLPLQVVAD